MKFTYDAVAEDQGDVFFANVVAQQINLNDQNAYARQLNIEGDNAANGIEAKVVNDGAEFIVLGLKTEGAGTVVKTINGGQSEVLGSWHNGPVDFTIPRFVTEDASLFAAGTTGSTASTGFNLVEETRDGETRTGNTTVDAYSAYDASLIDGRVIIVDNDEAETVGDFTTSGGPGGFLGEDFIYAAAGSDSSITYTAEAAEAGTYEVSIRNINDGGGLPTRNQATNVDILFGGGEDSFVFESFNMDAAEEQYGVLGTVTVDAGDDLFVNFSATDADGTIIADAVRFERVDDLNESELFASDGMSSDDLMT